MRHFVDGSLSFDEFADEFQRRYDIDDEQRTSMDVANAITTLYIDIDSTWTGDGPKPFAFDLLTPEQLRQRVAALLDEAGLGETHADPGANRDTGTDGDGVDPSVDR